MWCLQETHFRSRHTKTGRDRKRYFMQKEMKYKKLGEQYLISDKLDFKTKAVITDEEGPFIMIKGPAQPEGVTLVNTYTPHMGAPKCINKISMDIEGETDSNKVTVADCNTLPCPQWIGLPDRNPKRRRLK